MGTRFRLSAMMALAYAVQGAWWPILSVHLADLGVSDRGRGFLFATLAIAALVAPTIAGRIADRTLSAQRLLAILFASGACLLIVPAEGLVSTLAGLFPFFLVYWLLLIPYLNLTNTVAMRNLPRPREQFGSVRLWGTIGWMAAGWLTSGVMWASGTGTSAAFWVASGLSAVMAGLSLGLPDTPPLATQARGLAVREALSLLRRPGVLVLLATGFLVSLTTPFVYQAVPLYLQRHANLPRSSVATAMTLGQLPEIAALAFLPVVLRRMGRKGTLALGTCAWACYHGLLALTPGLALSLAAIPLNGLAIAFFHIAAPMYLDTQAPPDRRAGVQGLWVMTTSGLGSLCGGLLAGEVMGRAGGDWHLVFVVPTGIALAATTLILVGFGEASGSKAAAVLGSGHPLRKREAVVL